MRCLEHPNTVEAVAISKTTGDVVTVSHTSTVLNRSLSRIEMRILPGFSKIISENYIFVIKG